MSADPLALLRAALQTVLHQSKMEHTIISIPYSLCIRIVRVCSKEGDRQKKFIYLKKQLQERDYSKKCIDSAIIKARAVPKNALKNVFKKKKKQLAQI